MLRPFTTVFVDRLKAKRGKEYGKKRQVPGVKCWGEWTTVSFIFNYYFFSFLWPDYVALVLSVCSPSLEIADYTSLQEGLLS